MDDPKLESALRTHPCYNEDAHKKFARMHLPVAPGCNIQCNYCNRKYDCSNESRPGVTSDVLTPAEAIEKIRTVREKIPELKVVAIAGPGDPLANENTFKTLELINDQFSDLTMCVSTNGLMLPEYAERLYALGVRFITVTMNSIDPSVSEKIYSMVNFNGRTYKGREASEILLQKQLEGIKKCVKLGMVVKINSVLIPGINDQHIPDVVKRVKEMGAYIVNVLPLIPVEGTPFFNLRSPTPEERKNLMNTCSNGIKMMRHCRQCRADAIGLLDNDRSQEFVRSGSCGSGCGPAVKSRGTLPKTDKRMIAAATSDGKNIDEGFGSASEFRIYSVDGDNITFERTVKMEPFDDIYGHMHNENILKRTELLAECDIIVVKEIGPMPMSKLSLSGKKVITAHGDIKDIVCHRILTEDDI